VGGGGGGGGELLLPALQALQQHIVLHTIHCKKGYWFSRSQPGCLTKRWREIISLFHYSPPGRGLVTSNIPAGDRKTAKFFFTIYLSQV
jgi:hypothetical protein